MGFDFGRMFSSGMNGMEDRGTTKEAQREQGFWEGWMNCGMGKRWGL
jgi:hypothetical protein